jgi:hypothetical protein
MRNPKFIDVSIINQEIKDLKILLKKEDTFEKGIERFLQLHSQFYKAEMSGRKDPTFEDLLWADLDEAIMRKAVNEKGRTIIYGLLHASRIEDITMNMLVMRGDQIYDKKFKKEINAGIDHTGNSLEKDDILKMSSQVNINALAKYRLEVGRRSREIIKSLHFVDLKRKVKKEDIERVRNVGAVDDVPAANWLLTFWGSKTVEGILFMPASRHQVVHLGENHRAKVKGLKSATH